VGMVVMLFCTAFNNMFTPFLMERLSNLTQEKKTEIVRLSYLFLGIAVAALLLVNIFTPLFFHYLVDAKYARGASYVFWVSLGYFFWGCYLMFSGYLFFYKKTKIMMWISLCECGDQSCIQLLVYQTLWGNRCRLCHRPVFPHHLFTGDIPIE
jgi:O-antigen/teichoic acid export membrane protein